MNAELALQFFNDPDWDAPFFKRLAHNDTGKAKGHQGGIVIPKVLRPYFPALDEALASPETPTVQRHLLLEMYVAGYQIGCDLVRYQFQTWGNTRTAESRLTENLGPIRNKASGGDLFIMQRRREKLESYRSLLIRQEDAAFVPLDELTYGRNWGALFTNRLPVSQTEIVAARSAMLKDALPIFVPIRNDVPRIPTTRLAIARDTAFRETLLSQYRRQCAVSGIGLSSASMAEAEAAHVIPIARGGPDEPRNGLTLTGTLHWAFDKGLFGVSESRKIIVPEKVQKLPNNAWLLQFQDKPISEAISKPLRVAAEAFAWHRANLLSQWD